MCFLLWSRSEINSEKSAIACMYLQLELCGRKGPLTMGCYMINQCSECSCWVTGVTQPFQTRTDFGHSSEQVNALWWRLVLCCGLLSTMDPVWIGTIIVYNCELNLLDVGVFWLVFFFLFSFVSFFNLMPCHLSQAANCFFGDLQKDPKGPAGKASYCALLTEVAFVYI